MTVVFAVPVMRTVARMPLPSTREPMMQARRAVESRFILTVVLDPERKAKGYGQKI